MATKPLRGTVKVFSVALLVGYSRIRWMACVYQSIGWLALVSIRNGTVLRTSAPSHSAALMLFPPGNRFQNCAWLVVMAMQAKPLMTRSLVFMVVRSIERPER